MMNPSTFHPTPAWRNVMEAEFRSVGLAVRQLAVVAVLVMVSLTLILRIDALRQGYGISLNPEIALLVALFAPLLPVAVWKGEYRFRHSYLASMPVGRTRHVLTKMAAGWAWLMVLAITFLLWMVGIALLTGGEIGVDEMRVMGSGLPPGTLPENVDALTRRWTTPAWQWAVFFTGPTVAYLFASAVTLAGSRTRRWLAGLAVVFAFLLIIDDEVTDLGRVAKRLEMAMMIVVAGKYGLSTLFTIADAHRLTTAAGEEVFVWTNLPTLEGWAIATLLWTGLAVASVAAVVWGDRKD